jgi:hypothetical protein
MDLFFFSFVVFSSRAVFLFSSLMLVSMVMFFFIFFWSLIYL